jgi:predicted nucleic acid-binding protein
VITAVDTNVLLDLFAADPHFGPAAKVAMRACRNDGDLVACEVVWAELVGVFPTPQDAQRAMQQLGVRFSVVSVDAAIAAGVAWKAYRARGGSRQRMIADFLIGAHALTHADRLLTRDRGFYRTYFKSLRLLDPSRP